MSSQEKGRLANDVQRFGLLSAAVVVDRYRQLVDRAMGDGDLDGEIPGGPEQVDPSWLVDRASRLAGGYLRFLENAVLAVGSRAQHMGVERVVLAPTSPGNVTEGTIWLHNETGVETSPLELSATPLVAAAGSVISAEWVSFEPQTVRPVASGGTARCELRVEVATGASPGRYFGLVHMEGSDEPVVVELEVTPQ